ncbi:class I SAM-dependent methyltransferase [Streptomyces sp. NPDC056835]|uniref:class I SAM-dependent methyltransferase n=1 Tax=Streptomyces sp. NPDC056835 TaxID=3345956 RepID=UPI0036C5D718
MSWAYSELVTDVYECHLPVGYSNGDVEYYSRALSGITGKILEPACGTGRVLVPLLEMGFLMEGLDHSPEMLERCREHCRERGLPEPELHAADMASFVRPEVYGAVVMPAGSIRNIAGRELTLQTLDSFRQSLLPGGLLIVDVAAPRMATENNSVQIHQKDPHVLTVQEVAAVYDPISNRRTQYLRYEKWRDGDLVTTELHQFCHQLWGLDEFEELLAEVGYTDIRVTADYHEGSTPGPATGDWTFHAVRP